MSDVAEKRTLVEIDCQECDAADDSKPVDDATSLDNVRDACELAASQHRDQTGHEVDVRTREVMALAGRWDDE